MIAKTFISESLKPLFLSSTQKEAKQKMNSYRLFHVPVISEYGKFEGLFSEEELYDESTAETILKDVPEKLQSVKVYSNQHIFDIFQLAFSKKISCVPVVDDNNVYVGMIPVCDLINSFLELFSLHSPGALLIITSTYQNYSLSQIARIAEENNVKIISMYTHNVPDSVEIEITLKINTHDVSSIIQSFSRYNYSVKSYFEGYDQLQELYKDRIDSLLNYLNT